MHPRQPLEVATFLMNKTQHPELVEIATELALRTKLRRELRLPAKLASTMYLARPLTLVTMVRPATKQPAALPTTTRQVAVDSTTTGLNVSPITVVTTPVVMSIRIYPALQHLNKPREPTALSTLAVQVPAVPQPALLARLKTITA